jgi:rhamnosyltransferase
VAPVVVRIVALWCFPASREKPVLKPIAIAVGVVTVKLLLEARRSYILNTLKASVVVPTFNAGPTFEALLDKLFVQETDFDYEILVIDSGSTDGTLEQARRHGASVHQVPWAEFDHGATRDLGVSLSSGEYVAFIVQDAVPLDERWLAAMIENLDRDGLIAGVYGQQIPRPESSPLTHVLVNSRLTAGLERRQQFAGAPKRYAALPPAERRMLASFDNVSSCLRRSVWEEFPFGQTSFGEDLRWGKKVVEAGYKLVYEPRSAVFHSHERGAAYDLRRHYMEQRLLLDLFGLALVPNSLSLLSNILRSSAYLFNRLYQNDKAVNAVPRHALLAVKHAVFSQGGAYLGVKSRRLAAVSPRVFAKLDRYLSHGV